MIALTIILALLVLSLSKSVRKNDLLFEDNVEALSDTEIWTGPLCAYDLNVWCIYIYEDGTYDEFDGELQPWYE